MKLITLNTWGGRLKDELEAFLKEQAKDTDVFCFQEMFNASEEAAVEGLRGDSADNRRLLEDTKAMLPDFAPYFCPVIENTFGMAIFLRKGLETVASGEVLIYENSADSTGDHDRKMQWIHIKTGRKDFMVMNVHGHRDLNAGKDDTPNRIDQSKKINEFIKTTGSIPKVLVGDFNLNPDTESIKLLGEHVNNLIVEHGVASTRTEHYQGDQRHSDYIFVSSEIFVEKFEVMPDVVSDHAPLALAFDVF
jgi:endonuclease/exonuclease/phosphatase family metal-dependent hydrolase